MLVAAFVLAALPASAVARSVDPAPAAPVWTHNVVVDEAQLQHLVHQLAATKKRATVIQRQYRTEVRVVSARLAALYIAQGGGSSSLAARLVETNGRPARLVAAIQAIDVVNRRDTQMLRQFRSTCRQIPALRKRALTFARQIRTTRHHLRADISAARRAARHAAALAQIPQSPLLPVALSPAAAADQTAAAVASPASASSAGGQNSAAPASVAKPVGEIIHGVASVYSTSFAGKHTSNGDIYEPSALTAASTTIPLGTWVQVAGPSGSTLVLINDRGPFVGGRVIDLSSAAAAAVGINGLGDVTITVRG